MKKRILLVSLCILGLPLCAAEPENGIYERSVGASGSLVRTQDGRDVRLGERRTPEIRAIEMVSQNNENTRFSLSVTIPYDPNLGPSSYILIVDGTAYQQSGSGSSQNDSSSLWFNVSRDDKARQVARHFGTELRYRRHPHHELQISFTPVKDVFEIGEDIPIILRIVNLGANTISFIQGGRNRGARDNQYIFSAQFGGKQLDDIGTSFHLGGLAGRRVLNPGDVFEDKVSLKKWFSFEKAGMYELHGSYYLAFNDPADPTWRPIWEDYASADFIVTIQGIAAPQSANKD